MRGYFKYIFVLIFSLSIQFTVSAQDTLNFEEIEKSIDKYLKYFSDDNPGTVITVLKKGESVFSKAYGMANIPENEAMSVDKAFNLAELSKAFTALAILKLVEKNKLSLEDKLTNIFPDFSKYGSKISVKNILEHKSGLVEYNVENLHSNEEVLDFLMKQTEFIFEPGSKMSYSNSDYTLLVSIIEQSSGMSYQAYLRKYIFNKLSMNNTFFTEEIAVENIAHSHFKEKGKYVIKKEVNKIYGDQGIYMNSADFVKWDKALYTNKLLRCENLSKIFRIGKLTNGENKSEYSYGWSLMARKGIRYFWHGGIKNGYTNLVLHLPDTQTTVLILTNRNDGYDFLKMAIFIARQFDKELRLFDKELKR